MNSNRTKKLAQTIRERSLTISRAIALTTRNVVTATDYKTAQDIANHSSRVHYSAHGHDLINTIRSQIKYYQSVQACPVKEILCEKEGNVLGQNAFIREFTKLTKNNTGDIQNSLPVLFLQTVMSKMKGQRNTKYDERVFNFFVAIVASGDKRAFNFMSGNLRGMIFHHAQ
jgi:hypothetical protein